MMETEKHSKVFIMSNLTICFQIFINEKINEMSPLPANLIQRRASHDIDYGTHNTMFA